MNISKILSHGNYFNRNKHFCLVPTFILCLHISLSLIGCSNAPFSSPKALLKTFCQAYNSENDNLLYECGKIDYIVKNIAVEKIDADGNPYFIKVKNLNFEIIKIHTGRIGLEKEISNQRELIDVRFFSDDDPFYEKKVTIFMSQKKSTTSSDERWQVNDLPSGF
jgi:hypothetical protein